MAASPEYPDLPFIAPRAFGRGRDGRSVQVVVIHYTAGSERNTSAEDGAAYDQRRTDGVSTHYFHDQDSTIQCVLTTDRANAALYTGNRIGIQHELCGTAQTRAQWLDPVSDATITRAAKQAARDCAKYRLPIRKLTPEQVRSGQKGVCGHADITLAFPFDHGSHTDPGPQFPWDVFLARVQQYATGGGTTMTSPLTALEKAELQNAERYLQAVSGLLTRIPGGISNTVSTVAMDSQFVIAFKQLLVDVAAMRAQADAGGMDPAAVTALGVALNALINMPTAEAVAALVKVPTADDVVDALLARLDRAKGA